MLVIERNTTCGRCAQHAKLNLPPVPRLKTKTINGSKPCLEIRSNEDLSPDYHQTRPWWQKQRRILTIMIVKDWFKKKHPWGEEFQTNILLSRTMVVTYHPTCHLAILWSDHYFPCSPGNSQGLHLIPWCSYVSIRCDASIETCHLGRERDHRTVPDTWKIIPVDVGI